MWRVMLNFILSAEILLPASPAISWLMLLRNFNDCHQSALDGDGIRTWWRCQAASAARRRAARASHPDAWLRHCQRYASVSNTRLFKSITCRPAIHPLSWHRQLPSVPKQDCGRQWTPVHIRPRPIHQCRRCTRPPAYKVCFNTSYTATHASVHHSSKTA